MSSWNRVVLKGYEDSKTTLNIGSRLMDHELPDLLVYVNE